MSGLLEVRGLTVELPTPAGWVRPVNEVSLRISKGESLGLVGESGSGKTMLSLALMGLLPPGARVSGEASLTMDATAKNLTALNERQWRDVRGGEIAMIFQEPMTSLNPVMRVDVSVGAQVLLLLQEIQREFSLTYVFISHSLPVVDQAATRIAVMRAGQFLEVGAAEQVLHQPKNDYTRELLSAVPELPRS
jgi:ABC-type dipeptide/oligopeptide/nickel transport system ATPase component